MGFVQPVTPKPARNRLGCWLLVIGLIVLSILLWHFVLRYLFESGFGMADTRPVPGDPTRFDPIDALPTIVLYAGSDVRLISIEANYVQANGAVDLTAQSYWPSVTYTFVRDVPRPENAPPIGAGGTTSGTWYQEISVEAYRPGHWWSVRRGSASYQFMNQGMEREIEEPVGQFSKEPVPNPDCSFRDLWDVALAREAPPDAVAIINYDSQGYDFRIRDTSVNLRFDADCQLISE